MKCATYITYAEYDALAAFAARTARGEAKCVMTPLFTTHVVAHTPSNLI